MKVCVIGAGGFVASHLIRLLLNNEEEVIGTVRWNEDLYRLGEFKSFQEKNKLKIDYADLTDLSSLIYIISKYKPDIISVLGAQSWVPFSYKNPIATIETNAIGTLNVL